MRRSLFCLSMSCLVSLAGCAPVDYGADQCSDFNVALAALKDVKYTTLPESEGGLTPAQRNAVDAAVFAHMGKNPEAPVPGCAVGITHGHDIAYLRGYGLADTDFEHPRPFTVATPAAIGSISKTLTALAALALVEDYQLSIDQSLFDMMGEPASPFYDVTLRLALQHRGGFAADPHFLPKIFNDLPGIEAYYPDVPFPSLQPYLVLPGYRDGASQPDVPGSGPVYSNLGYSLVGALIDKRSRAADIPERMRGYERYVWHRVARGDAPYEPTLGTACLNTTFRQTDIRDLAKGYDKDGKSFIPGNIGTGWGWGGPSGGWSMTIGDLARLMLILQSDAVIPRQRIDTLMRADNGWSGSLHLGVGLELSAENESPPWFGKGGNAFAFTSDMKIWPQPDDANWGVAFICNRKNVDKSLTMDIHHALSHDTGDEVLKHGPDADTKLATMFEPLVRRLAAHYLDVTRTPDAAWALARADLLRQRGGAEVVAAIERGDLEVALRLLPSLTLRTPDGRDD